MKILILYASRRGQNAQLALRLQEVLAEEGLEADLVNVKGQRPDLLKDYDVLLLGSSTWGDGDLQTDFQVFEDGLRDLDLTGKAGAAFGTCSSMYPRTGWAVDILENRLKNNGGKVLQKGLKLDVQGGLNYTPAVEWARRLAARLLE